MTRQKQKTNNYSSSSLKCSKGNKSLWNVSSFFFYVNWRFWSKLIVFILNKNRISMSMNSMTMNLNVFNRFVRWNRSVSFDLNSSRWIMTLLVTIFDDISRIIHSKSNSTIFIEPIRNKEIETLENMFKMWNEFYPKTNEHIIHIDLRSVVFVSIRRWFRTKLVYSVLFRSPTDDQDHIRYWIQFVCSNLSKENFFWRRHERNTWTKKNITIADNRAFSFHLTWILTKTPWYVS